MATTFSYRNPIRSAAIGSIRDPQIIRVEDTYYLTGTCYPFWPGEVNPGVKMWSSLNLLDWTFERFLIDRRDLPEDAWYRDRFWAPEIHQAHNKFWLVFNSRNESLEYPHVHSCGLAVADSITGPYAVLTDKAPLLDGWGNDMTLFTDDDGTTYAYWKSHWVQRLDLEKAQLYGEKLPTLKNDLGTWEDIGIEGMFVVKRQGIYYMLYSSWTRGYEVGYATSSHPMGPWQKFESNPVYGSQDPDYCREKGVEFTGNPESPYFGAGHCTIFTGPDGQDWICAHHHMKHTGHKGADIYLGFDPVRFENGLVITAGPTWTQQTINLNRKGELQ